MSCFHGFDYFSLYVFVVVSVTLRFSVVNFREINKSNMVDQGGRHLEIMT